jgi:hypothetical protein
VARREGRHAAAATGTGHVVVSHTVAAARLSHTAVAGSKGKGGQSIGKGEKGDKAMADHTVAVASMG